MIALETLPEAARQAVQDLQADHQRQAQIIRDQEKLLRIQAEKIRWFNLKLWGPKGEKLSPAQSLILLDEASVSAQEVEQEASLLRGPESRAGGPSQACSGPASGAGKTARTPGAARGHHSLSPGRLPLRHLRCRTTGHWLRNQRGTGVRTGAVLGAGQ